MSSHSHLVSLAQSRDFIARSQTVREILLGGEPLNFDNTVNALKHLQYPNLETAKVTRDLSYGDHSRHKFDWFEPTKTDQLDATPIVLLFVHGGGFVRGDKKESLMPFYDNIGVWASEHGLHAATINYRLAPDHPWPAGAEDVRQATEAVAAHASKLAGSRPRIILMGHSAGAVHVASALTLGLAPQGVVAAILASGFYDNTNSKPNEAYFGKDPDHFAFQSSLPQLSASDIPLFLSVSERDLPGLHQSSIAVMHGRAERNKSLPQFLVVEGSNHFSPVLLLNSEVDTYGPRLLEFIGRFTHSPT